MTTPRASYPRVSDVFGDSGKSQNDNLQLDRSDTRFLKRSVSRALVDSANIVPYQLELELTNYSPMCDAVIAVEQETPNRLDSGQLVRYEGNSDGIDNDDTFSAFPTAKLRSRPATKKLWHSQYTVGWICALASEMTAAKAMLDELHVALPNSPEDDNAYQLGSISGHNVVITCLRMGVYGTTSATAVAIAMRSTYPNSHTLPLMVGIGGGVPYPDSHDIRLGDVVISTPTPEHPAVVQYDHGKITQGGVHEVRGTLNKPAPAMLKILNHLKSELVLGAGQLSKHISKAQSQFSGSNHGFFHPGIEEDILYVTECEHIIERSAYQQCPPRHISRIQRTESLPIVHYGSIASGNRVIKHARTRDSIAARFGILCFEMEAAGLMDYFPCLVIRGICDYCDEHKNKEWQNYAALTAAAVAKELLRLTTISQIDKVGPIFARNQALSRALEPNEIQEHRHQLLAMLKFDDSRTRRVNVKQAHPDTCMWIFKHDQVVDWIRPQNYPRHRGFLWIKGKPGTGKSTIMKYLLDNMPKSVFGHGTTVTASFFFSARGSELGRTSIGMYRSLLDQIFEQASSLQKLLDEEPFLQLATSLHQWTLSLLEELFRRVIQNLGSFHLLCFIDALDECPDNEAREMIELLQDLSHLATSKQLHICFSSRHYPHITVKAGNQFMLENQDGHSQDIKNYLDAKLIIGNESLNTRLKDKVHNKSGQIFFWVVLVVRILQKEYDRGRLRSIERIIDELPSQVDELFRRILTRDSIDLPQMVTSIQWVLYVFRPLTPHELYHGLLASELLPSSDLEDGEQMDTDDVSRYIIDCSKGIMEVTMPPTLKVQFIHETVREFLLQPSALLGLWPGFEGITDGHTHERLKNFCYSYVLQPKLQRCLNGRSKLSYGTKFATLSDFPLADYAMLHLLDHAEHAQRSHISQADFIDSLMEAPFALLCNLDNPAQSYRSVANLELHPQHRIRRLGLILATTSRPALRVCWFERIATMPDWADKLHQVLLTMTTAGSQADFNAMITVAQDYYGIKNNRSEAAGIIYRIWKPRLRFNLTCLSSRSAMILALLIRQKEASHEHLNEALCIATSIGVLRAVKFLIALGADIDSQDENGRTAIHHAVYRFVGHSLSRHREEREQILRCVKWLCDQGADCNIEDNKKRTSLQLAEAYRNTIASSSRKQFDSLVDILRSYNTASIQLEVI